MHVLGKKRFEFSLLCKRWWVGVRVRGEQKILSNRSIVNHRFCNILQLSIFSDYKQSSRTCLNMVLSCCLILTNQYESAE